MQIDMEPGALRVMLALNAAGYRAYAVGGCVRDSLLGKTPNDWDICTSAMPDQVIGVFGGQRCIKTGVKHGTVTVKGEGGNLYEVTTFRTEGGYSDGRHPDSVDFIGDVRGDLARRDFTINAMAYHPDEGLIDPFGGQQDLLGNRLVRAVGEPQRRFTEDALRIMRLFRFAARENLGIEDETLRAALTLAKRLSLVSAERIREEFVKLLAAQKPGVYMPQAIVSRFIPELQDAAAYARALRAVDAAQDVPVRLAALLLQAGGQAEAILRRMKFDTKTIACVTQLIALRDVQAAHGEKALRVQARRMLGKMELAQIERLCQLRDAQRAAGEEKGTLSLLLAAARASLAAGDCCRLGQLAVTGRDLIAHAGAVPGPQVGAALEKLLDAVVNEEIINEKEALLSYIGRD